MAPAGRAAFERGGKCLRLFLPLALCERDEAADSMKWSGMLSGAERAETNRAIQ